MKCTNGCLINNVVGGDHAYCTCKCHKDTWPANEPSRERQPKLKGECPDCRLNLDVDGWCPRCSEYFPEWVS